MFEQKLEITCPYCPATTGGGACTSCQSNAKKYEQPNGRVTFMMGEMPECERLRGGWRLVKT